jgi:hypothetical protein
MFLRHDQNYRVILVLAARPDHPWEQCSITIMALVTVDGGWSGKLDIRCAAYDRNCPADVWTTPVMRGRGAVPLEELGEALKKTLEEQEQVVAAMRMAVDGPYSFAETCWDKPSDVVGI